MLAVTGNAVPISVDHRVIGDDHLDPVFGLTDGDILPVFVSPELRKREPPFGTFKVYLSCAAMAMLETASNTV
jgi:hypothetical protein